MHDSHHRVPNRVQRSAEKGGKNPVDMERVESSDLRPLPGIRLEVNLKVATRSQVNLKVRGPLSSHLVLQRHRRFKSSPSLGLTAIGC